MIDATEISFWEALADDLDLEIVAPFELALPDGGVLSAAAVIRNFGPPLGMVVAANFDVLQPHTAFLKNAGYGYSSNIGLGPYDRDGMIEVLMDWGWNGPADEKPDWLD